MNRNNNKYNLLYTFYVYDFTMFEIGDFFGINTILGINPNSIPWPVHTER